MRNGLIHEGRIKCGCYLDNRIKDAVQEEEGILVFNPNVVLQKLDSWLKTYLQKIEKGGLIQGIVLSRVHKAIDITLLKKVRSVRDFLFFKR